MIDIKVEALSEIDKMFGVWKRQADFHLLINNFLILAKQHIYSCRNKGYPPSLKSYLAKVSLKLRLLNQMVRELLANLRSFPSIALRIPNAHNFTRD